MENIEPMKKINVEMPETTKKKLKVICNIKNVTIKEYVLKLIEDDIKNTDFNKLVNEL